MLIGTSFMIKLKNVINKHKSNKIKENSNTVRHLNNGTDHRHSKSCCDQSSPARRTINVHIDSQGPLLLTWINFNPSMTSYYIHYNVWDEITYPFLNFDDATVEV